MAAPLFSKLVIMLGLVATRKLLSAFEGVILCLVFIGVTDEAVIIMIININKNVLDFAMLVLTHRCNLSGLHVFGCNINRVDCFDRNEE